ncbi:MAG: hypothetical protein A2939_04500 [Parcubacteria group bacterium RIFCSPLOWO2_01_FULL_48_18]|nr:MAG: hypothetical protein A2939_04500 [Parcubacteria group bacterium RIFCSPLOWO2_01_FULL_48_18]
MRGSFRERAIRHTLFGGAFSRRFIFFFLAAVIIAVSFWGIWQIFLSLHQAEAQATIELYGWAWANVPQALEEGAGWISFNCANQGVCSSTPYAVRIQTSNGRMYGYGWSEHFGWLSFNDGTVSGSDDLNNCPSFPPSTCIAEYNSVNGQLSGWARFVTSSADFEGWVHLRGSNYGVEYNQVSGELMGWAWGDVVAGWISFNCLNEGTCVASDYNVSTNPRPSGIDLVVSQDPMANAPLVENTSVTFTATTTNIGLTAATSTFNNRFQIDLNSVSFATSDVMLTPHPTLSGIGAGQSSAVTSAAWTAVLGTHTLRFCADQPFPAVPEASETNNCRDWVFAVTFGIPTVDIKANGSDSPPSLPDNSTATLSWVTANNPDTCTGSSVEDPGWNGSKATSSGSEVRGPLAGPLTYLYTITCSNIAGFASDTVAVAIGAPAPPAAPSNPSPAHNATNVSVYTDLDWDNAAGATNYDVYFGTSPTPPFAGNTTMSFWLLPALNYSTLYRWQIVSKNAGGDTFGPVWQFTTEPPSAPTCTIDAVPQLILLGQETMISWNCFSPGGVDSTTLNGSPPPPASSSVSQWGNQSFTPLTSTLYTVIGCNTSGCGSDSILVGAYRPKIKEVLPKF